MNTYEIIAKRICRLCGERGITPNQLSALLREYLMGRAGTPISLPSKSYATVSG